MSDKPAMLSIYGKVAFKRSDSIDVEQASQGKLPANDARQDAPSQEKAEEESMLDTANRKETMDDGEQEGINLPVGMEDGPEFKDQVQSRVARVARLAVVASSEDDNKAPLHEDLPEFKDQVRSNAARKRESSGEAQVVERLGSVDGDVPLLYAGEAQPPANDSNDDVVFIQPELVTVEERSTSRSFLVLYAVIAIAVVVVAATVTTVLLTTGSSDDNIESEPATREERILLFLNGLLENDPTIDYVESFASPPEQATRWLIEDDPLQLDPTEQAPRFRMQQRFALLVLWFQLSGDGWTNSSGWLVDTSECRWYGVSCLESTGNDRSTLAVDALSLQENNLRGEIPAELCLLSVSLVGCSFDGNAISGALPESFGCFTNLEHFSVSRNAITGSIPASFGAWTNLKLFWLNSNAVNGKLPDTIGQWTSLTDFRVFNTALSGTLPDSVSGWTNLLTFLLYDTDLTGEMPFCTDNSTGTSLDALEADCGRLQCSCCTLCALSMTSFVNNITLSRRTIDAVTPHQSPEEEALDWLIRSGPIPDDAPNRFRTKQRFGLAVFFYGITAPAFRISGSGWLVNDDECSWDGLRCRAIEVREAGIQNAVSEIDIESSTLSGRLSSDLGLLSASLSSFDASDNKISGSIPAALGMLTKLVDFDVGGNLLSGTLPETIGQWTALQFFSASGNALTGTLPASIRQLTALRLFHVYENNLSGDISSFGPATKMESFQVYDNSLTGFLPESLSRWTNLNTFDVEGNAMIGTVPSSFVNWKNLRSAWFNTNNVTGMMPFCDDSNFNASTLDILTADCEEIACPCCTHCCVQDTCVQVDNS